MLNPISFGSASTGNSGARIASLNSDDKHHFNSKKSSATTQNLRAFNSDDPSMHHFASSAVTNNAASNHLSFGSDDNKHHFASTGAGTSIQTKGGTPATDIADTSNIGAAKTHNESDDTKLGENPFETAFFKVAKQQGVNKKPSSLNAPTAFADQLKIQNQLKAKGVNKDFTPKESQKLNPPNNHHMSFFSTAEHFKTGV